MSLEGINDDIWTDITDEFKSAVKQLSLGELIRSDHFTLLEAMSAIELMDPKIDIGMVFLKSNRRILTFDQAVESGSMKVNKFSAEELIGIIDETYRCLATWLEGSSLSHTVMTNLYLHEPEKIEDRCLRIFSLSMLKIVDFMDKLVQIVFCIEEEDFHLNCGKFNLANHMSDQKVLSSLEELCTNFEKSSTGHQSLNSIRNQAVSNDKVATPQPDMSDYQDFDQNLVAALISRLRFTQCLYAFFMEVHKSLLKSSWDLNPQPGVPIGKTVKLIQNSILKCDQCLEDSLSNLEHWSKTIDCGIKSKKNLEISFVGDSPTIMGFDPFVNLKLLPCVYPRCPTIKSRENTVKFLVDLITKLRRCITISASFNQKSFEKSLSLIEEFSKHPKPGSCVISRSFIQALYLPNRSPQLFKEELLQSIIDYCEPQINEIRKDETRSESLDAFLSESTRSFMQAVIVYGHNTVRQHERLTDLITHFKSVQYSALIVDRNFNNSIVYSWTTFNLARLCIKYVLSSLELELFSIHEYPYVFWYLNDMLYRNEKEQLELAKQYILESQIIANDNYKKTKGKKPRKKHQYQTSYHDKSLVCNSAFRLLSGGLFLLTYGLKLQGKIKAPVMNLTSEEMCFEHRFGPLTGTSVYTSYKRTLDRLDNLEHIYREAVICFSDAKEIFESIGQSEDCLKVCRANMVVARILSSNLNTLADRDIEFCFKAHASFPIVKV